MYLFENPVLQRELVINLRMTRSFVLLFTYVALLGMLVYAAWPGQQKLDMAVNEERYEDAVILRDKIKDLEEKDNLDLEE